jgi:Mn2+/Fe2+ NRAMP family transporter
MTSNPAYMKAHANSLSVKLLAWVLFALITGANLVLLGSLAEAAPNTIAFNASEKG